MASKQSSPRTVKAKARAKKAAVQPVRYGCVPVYAAWMVNPSIEAKTKFIDELLGQHDELMRLLKEAKIDPQNVDLSVLAKMPQFPGISWEFNEKHRTKTDGTSYLTARFVCHQKWLTPGPVKLYARKVMLQRVTKMLGNFHARAKGTFTQTLHLYDPALMPEGQTEEDVGKYILTTEDANHRLSLIRSADVNLVPVELHFGLTSNQGALLMCHRNNNSKNGPNGRFRCLRYSGDIRAVRIDKTCTHFGFSVTPGKSKEAASSMEFHNASALMDIEDMDHVYRKKPYDLLYWTLYVLRHGCQTKTGVLQKAAKEGQFMLAIADYLKDHHEPKRMVQFLTNVSVEVLAELAGASYRNMRCGCRFKFYSIFSVLQQHYRDEDIEVKLRELLEQELKARSRRIKEVRESR